jgi:hypothetical protein
MREMLLEFFNRLIKKDTKECISIINTSNDVPFNKIIEQNTNNNILHLSFFSKELFQLIYTKYPELIKDLNNDNEYPLHILLRKTELELDKFKEYSSDLDLYLKNKNNEDIPYILINKKYYKLIDYLFHSKFKFKEDHLAILNYYIKTPIADYIFPAYVKPKTIIRPIYKEIDQSLIEGKIPYYDKTMSKKLYVTNILESNPFNYFKMHCSFIMFKTKINYDLSNDFLNSDSINESFTFFENEVELLIELVHKMKDKNYSDMSIIKLLKSIPTANIDLKSIKNIFPLFDLTEKCKFVDFDDFYSKINMQINIILINRQETIELNQSIGRLENLYFSDDLIFKIPKTQKDLAELGLILRICVGTYTDRVLSNTSQICYLYNVNTKQPTICVDLNPLNHFEIREVKYKNNKLVETDISMKIQKIVDSELYSIK